jgi:hypothetical protein
MAWEFYISESHGNPAQRLKVRMLICDAGLHSSYKSIRPKLEVLCVSLSGRERRRECRRQNWSRNSNT